MSPETHTMGSLRYESEIRQISALLLLTGICAIFQPIDPITALINGDPQGETATSGTELWTLVGALCIMTIGFGAIFIGFNQLVLGWSNKYLTGFNIVFLQSGYILYITLMTDIGQKTKDGVSWIPAMYNPSETGNHLVGAMGILAVLTYAFATVGAIAFFLFALFAFQDGKPEERPAGYFRTRLAFYSFVLFFSGLCQLILGGYLTANISGGGLDAPIVIAVYVVYFPAINVVVGLTQLLNGLWGLARSMGVGVPGADDHTFQLSMYIAWFLQTLLQVVVQIGYSTIAGLGGPASTVVALSFSLYLMPAYLDHKMRSMPEVIEQGYYNDSAVADAKMVELPVEKDIIMNENPAADVESADE